MTPSSPGFNPPKFSFNKKKLGGSISIQEKDDVIQNQFNTNEVEEYPDELFDSLIDDIRKDTEDNQDNCDNHDIEGIEDNEYNQDNQETQLPLTFQTSHSAQPAQLTPIQEIYEELSQPQPPLRKELYEPKPTIVINGSRLIVQLTAFAASLDSFKSTLQQRQNALDLAVLGLDEKLGKRVMMKSSKIIFLFSFCFS